MTIHYDSIAYCAMVRNGKVEYFEEYYNNGSLVYSIGISYQAYVNAIGGTNK